MRALAEVPSGMHLGLDANIFIYAFGRQSVQCAQLLERCQDGNVRAVTTIEVVSEVCHRFMLLEAFENGIITRASAPALRARADGIKNLARYWMLASRIFDLNIKVLALEEVRARRAQLLRITHGLLTNDSLIAAALQQERIQNLATSDRDFERVGWLTVYAPTDLS